MNKEFEHIYQNELTPRQKEVIPGLLQGLSNKEIAGELNVKNPNTITHRISSIRQKFDAIDKADLIYIFNRFKPELVSNEARRQAGIVENPAYEINYPECSEILNSPFYIQRDDIDNRCQNLIDKQGCLIRIKAPKQMGKTSLINRLFEYAEQQNNYIVYYDFSFVDVNTLNNIDSFFYSLSSYIAEELSDITNKDFSLESWNNNNSLTEECTKFLKKSLRKIERPLVLIFDETDRIFQYDSVYQSFAPLLRHWHERGRNSDIWKKLKLVLAHSTEEYVTSNIDRSPFTNVGETINLVDFTSAQVTELAVKHGIKNDRVVNSLMSLVGGHPYLIRLALYHLAKNNLSLEQLLAQAATDSGIYREHLQRHLMRLQKNRDLETAFRQVIENERSIVIKEQHIKHKLEGMGLIAIKGNLASVRYNLYRQYFNNYLF